MIARKLSSLLQIIKKSLIILTKGYVHYARSIGVKVGENCRLYISDFGSEPFLITIGNRVTVASGVKLITHDGSTWLFRDEKGRRYHYRRIDIGDNVFIGMNTVLLPGVRVGNNVIIGAGSVVTKSIPDNLVVAGNPAKVIMTFSEYEKRALETYVSEQDLPAASYVERVSQIVDNTFKKSL